MKALRAVDSRQMLVTAPMMITVSTWPAPQKPGLFCPSGRFCGM
ncbi:hypothetical protein [Mesorhizobium hawassense]|nr:hypothetical protein [Mesorhizobium hawassense]